jgi:hypothetical protein
MLRGEDCRDDMERLGNIQREERQQAEIVSCLSSFSQENGTKPEPNNAK